MGNIGTVNGSHVEGCLTPFLVVIIWNYRNPKQQYFTNWMGTNTILLIAVVSALIWLNTLFFF